MKEKARKWESSLKSGQQCQVQFGGPPGLTESHQVHLELRNLASDTDASGLH
jgi:hypothetical protein